MSRRHKEAWFRIDTPASCPVVALMPSGCGDYRHRSSSSGLGGGCTPAASALCWGGAGGKGFTKACEILLRASPIILKVRAAPDFYYNT